MGRTNIKRVLRDILRAATGQSHNPRCFCGGPVALLFVAAEMLVLQSIDYRLGFSNVSLPRFQFSYKQHSTYRNLFSMTELGCKITCHSENPEVWQKCHWSSVRHKMHDTYKYYSIRWAKKMLDKFGYYLKCNLSEYCNWVKWAWAMLNANY